MSASTPLPPRTRSGVKVKAAKKQKRRPRRWLWFLLVFFAIVIVGLGVYAGNLWQQANNALNKVALPAGNANPIASADRAQVKPLSMLLLGMDYRKQTGSMNTDVVMLIAMNPKSNTATVVSVPRDTDPQLDGYVEQKINAFYAYYHRRADKEEKLKGAEADAYARDQMKELASDMFGIPVNYSAVINFQGFSDVVDALGGIDVYVDQNMKYRDDADGTNINLKKGDQHLDGKNALDFVRYRKSNEGTAQSSDFERNDRQSRVLGAVVDKMKSVGGALKLGNVIGAVGDNMETDIPKAQIENMLKAYYDIDRNHIRFLPLEGVWKSPYVYLNDDSLEQAKQALAEEMTPNGRTVEASASPSSSASASQ
ncbi:LCP family protein [Cohnella zeiphila]|uniref:LCP family protein n=1 Tax=Cohnella zeiphila TaxID=2761120 RepID=A0A7X0SGT7_9BACL|nr:LCP family protein [Cohnella zeiphila]MBB6729677.1 LCP family protein [Cohnella zeiphila]